MASDSEIIRSFLVSVGVQVDEKGMKRFDQGVEKITATTKELAKAAAAAALAVSAGVVKIAANFEDLFYASQRLRSSVDNIKAFSFGVGQMGGNAKAARESLESFASFMRSNPMGEGVVRGLGVETRDAAGNAREYADVLRDVGKQLRLMPYWAAKQRANLLGIDENTLQALLRGTDLWSDRYRKMVKQSGVNMDQMAADMTSLMNSFRLMRVELEIYLYKAISKVNPELLKLAAIVAAVGGSVAILTALLGPEVVAVLALGAAIVALTNDFADWKAGSESFLDWGAWSGDIDEATQALGALGGAISELFADLAPIAKQIGDVIGPALTAFAHSAVDVLTQKIWRLSESIRTLSSLLKGDLKGAAEHWLNSQSGTMPAPASSKDSRAAARARPGAAPGAANDNPTPATRDARSQALAYFMRQGWTREQALGIVAGSFAESGLRADNRNPKSGAYGIGQWLSKDRIGNFSKVMGKPLEGSSLQDQLAFMQWELMNSEKRAGSQIAGTKNAHDALSAFVTKYERPKLGAETSGDMQRGGRFLADQARLGADGGSRTVTINAKTDVKVSGAVDAKAAGKAVGDSVDRRNSDLVRQTRTAVR